MLLVLGFYLVHLVHLCKKQGLQVWLNKDEGDELDVSQGLELVLFDLRTYLVHLIHLCEKKFKDLI